MLIEQVEAYAKLNVGQLLKIMQIDGKFVSLTCLALLRKLDRGTTKYQMAEVRYLIYVLLRDLMQTPLVGFDAKSKISSKGINKGGFNNGIKQ